ncbi:MAG: hypothetical protein LBN03_01645 [Bifidobacteriaceae bacterium]|jgi:hypothetical protein|nr:hypothetical protein [Bifidobacteriaceae bacterium]
MTVKYNGTSGEAVLSASHLPADWTYSTPASGKDGYSKITLTTPTGKVYSEIENILGSLNFSGTASGAGATAISIQLENALW